MDLESAPPTDNRELPWLSQTDLRIQRRIGRIKAFGIPFLGWYVCCMFLVFGAGGPPRIIPAWLFWPIVLPLFCLLVEVVSIVAFGVISVPFILIGNIPAVKSAKGRIVGSAPVTKLNTWARAVDDSGLIVPIFAAISFALLGLLLWLISKYCW